ACSRGKASLWLRPSSDGRAQPVRPASKAPPAIKLRQKKDGACPVERGIVGFLAGSIFMESSLWSWTSLHIVAPPTLGIWTSICNQHLQQVTGRTTIKQPPML